MKKVLALLLLFICTWELQAQILQPEHLEFIDDNKIIEALSESNLLIQQISQADNAFVETDQQMNFNNRAFINQHGNNHNTRLSQTGIGNEALLLAVGGLTNTEVNQTGSNNSIVSILGNNSLQLYSAMLEQKGDGNKIKLALLMNDEVPGLERVVSVTQTGNDLNFSFFGTNNSPDVPVNVEQKSGVNGQGMDVNVTTSAFYFPLN